MKELPVAQRYEFVDKAKYYAVQHSEYGWMMALFLEKDGNFGWWKDFTSRIAEQYKIIKWVDLDAIDATNDELDVFEKFSNILDGVIGKNNCKIVLDGFKSCWLKSLLERYGIIVEVEDFNFSEKKKSCKFCKHIHKNIPAQKDAFYTCRRYPIEKILNNISIYDYYCGEFEV